MANNPFIFDGALAGATGAINERWLTNTDPNSYIGIRNLLVAFANAVDTLIPTSGGITSADGALIQNICNGVLSQRFLTSESNVQGLAQAIVALFQTIRSQLIPLPYPSTDTLSTVKYVDRTVTLPIANQSGSIISPFATVAQAVTALATGGTIVIVPGDYSSEGAIALPAGDWTLTSVDPHANYAYGSQGAKRATLTGLTGAGTPNVNLISIECGAISGVGAFSGDSAWFTGAIGCDTLNAFDCRTTNTASIALTGGGMSMTDCRLDALAVTCPNAGIFRFVDCELNTSFTLTSGATGTLRICGRTNAFLQAITNTLTNVTVLLQDTGGPNPNAPTPIVATGALGVVNIAAIQNGGCVVFQPSAAFNLDGFTAKTNGFWFDAVMDTTNLAFVGTVNQDVGSTTTSVRCPYNQPYQMVAGSATRFRWQLNRFRVASPPTLANNATILVAVPALVSMALGYVDVSLVGSNIAGTPANAQVIAAPQADLGTSGLGGGFYIGGRMSATNTFRMAFVGGLSAGNTNFTLTRL